MSDALYTGAEPRTLNLIVGLLRSYMGLEAPQVVVYNQKWKVPSDNRLYITVGLLAFKPYGNSTITATFTDTNGSGLKEVSTLHSQESVSVNMFSRSEEAVDRRGEPILAFGSTEAAQLCDRYAIKFGRLPVAMTDLSGVEGAARLNRYVATINLLCARKQERVVQYFDKFPAPTLVINP